MNYLIVYGLIGAVLGFFYSYFKETKLEEEPHNYEYLIVFISWPIVLFYIISGAIYQLKKS